MKYIEGMFAIIGLWCTACALIDLIEDWFAREHARILSKPPRDDRSSIQKFRDIHSK